MSESESTFPNTGVEPGEYALEWLVGKTRRFNGDVALAPRRRPKIDLYGKFRRRRPNKAGQVVYSLPGADVRVPRLVGQLRSNEEVVVIDAVLSEWFPERYQGFGRWAIVGLDVASVPGDRYEHVSFQISDADLWFGVAPIAKLNWPKPKSATKTYSATLERAANRVWRDTRNGITVDFGYPHSYSVNFYRFGLTFAPVFDLTSREPLTLDEWRDEWIAPLIDLASIATKQPQTLSWLKVHHGTGRTRVSGTVFSWGVHQSPYAAHYDNEWRLNSERRPLFRLAQLPVTPMKLVRKWRGLQASDDPFVELYRAALFQPDLPPRARFLHLIQALEARHSYANRAADAKAQVAFEARRAQVVDAATKAGLTTNYLRFLKDEWSKRRADSLERRLLPLLNALPPRVRKAMESDTRLDAIRKQLIADAGATTFEAQLRVLRNQLSHGDRNYPDYELAPWVAAVETLCRAQLLALQRARLEVPLLDPQRSRQFGIVTTNILDEPLGIVPANEDAERVSEWARRRKRVVDDGVDDHRREYVARLLYSRVAAMDERTVVLKPSFIEWGLYRDDYLGLARELEVEGVVVELVRPEGGPEWRNIDPTTARDLYDVVVSIGRIAQSVLGISDLVDRIRLRLRDPGREEERIGVIYLADGTKHEFPLDND